MKKFILGTIFGLLISGGVVFASKYLYKADEVSYTPKDTTWNVDNVDSAIHDLYSKTDGVMKIPTKTLNITANGSNIDVTNYAKVNVNVANNPSFGLVASGGDMSGGTSVNISGYKRYIVFVHRSNNEDGYPTVSGCGATFLGYRHMVYAQVSSVYYCTSSGTITISGDVVRGYFVIGVN